MDSAMNNTECGGYWMSYSTSSFNGYDEDKNAKWIDKKFYRCSECRKGTVVKTPYCPYCGAYMNEEVTP